MKNLRLIHVADISLGESEKDFQVDRFLMEMDLAEPDLVLISGSIFKARIRCISALKNWDKLLEGMLGRQVSVGVVPDDKDNVCIFGQKALFDDMGIILGESIEEVLQQMGGLAVEYKPSGKPEPGSFFIIDIGGKDKFSLVTEKMFLETEMETALKKKKDMDAKLNVEACRARSYVEKLNCTQAKIAETKPKEDGYKALINKLQESRKYMCCLEDNLQHLYRENAKLNGKIAKLEKIITVEVSKEQ